MNLDFSFREKCIQVLEINIVHPNNIQIHRKVSSAPSSPSKASEKGSILPSWSEMTVPLTLTTGVKFFTLRPLPVAWKCFVLASPSLSHQIWNLSRAIVRSKQALAHTFLMYATTISPAP